MINVTNTINNGLLESLDPGSFQLVTSEGWYGSVYKVYLDDKPYALKVFKPTMHEAIFYKDVATYDYDILKCLNKSKHYPTLHAYKENEWMLVDWIDGIPFRNINNKDYYFSQLFDAHMDAIKEGWFPDDIKGDNIVWSDNRIMIIDVGSYLPIIPDLEFNVFNKVSFILEHANTYPSVRDKSPYNFKTIGCVLR